MVDSGCVTSLLRTGPALRLIISAVMYPAEHSRECGGLCVPVGELMRDASQITPQKVYQRPTVGFRQVSSLHNAGH